MSVLLNKEKNELMINCNCGCDEGIFIRIDEDPDYEDYAYITYLNSHWYSEQYGAWDVFKKKLKKIWSIIRNKDHYYSDIIMSKEDFKTFADFILNHYTKQLTKEINQ